MNKANRKRKHLGKCEMKQTFWQPKSQIDKAAWVMYFLLEIHHISAFI